jgi:Ca2+-binding RTX toxin-like protein
MYGSGANDTLQGSAGDDTLYGQAGNDVLNGGSGNDVIGVDIDGGGSGTDTIQGGSETDTLRIVDNGGDSETLAVSYNGTRITNIEGATTVAADVEIVTADGGAGADDNLSYTAPAGVGVTVDLTTGTASGFTSIANFENVSGTAQGDTITGSGAANDLDGNAGNDTINGEGGNDNIVGEGGLDTINGGAGNDAINGGANGDTINGGDNNDTITQVSTEGRDLVDGGAGADNYQLNGVFGGETFRIYTRAAFLALNPAAVLAAGTEIVITRNGTTDASVIAELDNIEEIAVNTLNVTVNDGNGQPNGGGAGGGDTVQVIGNFAGTSLNFSTITVNGGQGDDFVDISQLESEHRIVFTSNGGDDAIIGEVRPQDVIDWDDVINGTSADNALNGGDGNDYISGAGGNDIIWGGAGNDRINGGTGADDMSGNAGNDVFYVDNAGDVVREVDGEGSDIVYASADWIMTSGEAIEQLRANYGSAPTGLSLTGNERANYIGGGAANDTITGGGGNDTMNGNGGDDVFVFATGSGRDRVLGFDVAGDKLDISGLGVTADNYQASVSISQVGDNTVVKVGNDWITLVDVSADSVNQSSFILG